MWGPRNNDVIDQKRQLLLTNRATHLCKRNDMAGLKNLPLPIVTMPNLVDLR